jgi:(1->4)-alpha-D-glucan 1-alpha-D-glucosylmutase
MDTSMASELNVLAHMLDRLGERNRKSRDFTLNSFRDAITEVVACFPAYRTYVSGEGWTAEDRAVLEQAIVRARRRNPAMDPTIFDFFREVVLPRELEDVVTSPRERRGGFPPTDATDSADRLRFAMKFQQYTGPLQAKGLEDTAFYRYNLLISLNEVGGDPSRFGRSPREFHEANLLRRTAWPYEMITTATHDTKLGEDVRARINVLSELPDEWGREVARWMRLNRSLRPLVDGDPAPDRNDEYRIYQALIGIWPSSVRTPDDVPKDLVPRLQAYMTKAAKEAKIHSSWINPNVEYEQAVAGFIERILSGPGGAKFLPAFLPMQQRIARAGAVNSLAQVVLKVASPGVPDFYQGTETWDLSLVDPDNRRPVDFDLRRRMLDAVDAVSAASGPDRLARIETMARHWEDGAIKLFVTALALRLRRDHQDLFLEGDYLPLEVDQTVPARAIAFARTLDDRAAIAIAPHLSLAITSEEQPMPIGDRWMTSRILLPSSLAGRTFTDVFTGVEIMPVAAADASWIFVGQALRHLPVALLMAK